MIGTTYHRNVLHRLGDAWNAFKALPQPGALYPPPQNNNSTGWINWEGWPAFETQQQGERDKANVKKAIRSPWVFADVQAIANEFSTAELIVKERRGDKLEDVDNHPLEQIWESPNEHMGRSFVCAFWAWSYTLASRAYLYWVPSTNGGPPMEVWPIPPFMMKPLPSKDDFIGGYMFRVSPQADPIFIPSEYITYSHSVNLFDARDGLSFLAASMTEIEGDIAASVWNKNFFDDSNGIPDGFLGVDASTLDNDLDRIRMELRDWFGGTKRGIAVGRSGDLKYTEFGRSQKDMEFINGREFASKIIGRTLGFPDGYWSDLANRANAEQARRTMISGAVWPLLVRLSEDMNAHRRGVVQRWFGESYRAEFKDIRPEDKEMKLRELTTYQAILPLGRLLEMIGQEPLGDIRDEMLVAEINKGAPLPGTKAAQMLEEIEAEKAEAEAQEQAAQVEAGLLPDPNAPPELADGDVTEEEAAMDDEGVPMKALDDNAFDTLLATPQSQAWLVNAANEALEDFKAGRTEPMENLWREEDLRKWEAKSLKSLKRFKKADVLFTSDAIPLPEQVAIHAALKAAQTAQEVKDAFRQNLDHANAGVSATKGRRDALAVAGAGDGGVEDSTKAAREIDALLESVDAEARKWVEEAGDADAQDT